MWSAFCAVLFFGLVAGASRAPSFSGDIPRRAVLPIRLQTRHVLQARSNSSGLTSTSLSSDKQSYYSVIQAGNISFRVALDTGSSDLWLMSTGCASSNCKSSPRYPLTYWTGSFVPVNNNNTAFGVGYADGTTATGFVGRETIKLSNLTLANQAFGVINASNVTFNDQVSGILGLGFPRLSSISQSVASATPFFASLAQQGYLDYPLFGLSLARNASGTLSIGAVDISVVQNLSNVGWNEVVAFSPFGSESNTSSYLQWAIPISGISINGTGITPLPTYPNALSNSSIALLDIGTSGIYGPYQDVSRLFSLIPGSRFVDSSGQWVIPCATSETMSFTFGGQNYTLQPSDFLIGPAAGNPDLCLSWPRATAPSSDGIDWQLGSAFLRTVYSIFSYGINTKEPPMIGFYPLTNSSTAETPASISAFLSSASATIPTTLPNFLLSEPSFTTPPYAFNTSVPASVGEIVSSGLATSTYIPALGGQLNASALPTVAPSPTLETFIVTSSGLVLTQTSTLASPSVTLGIPGWGAGTALRAPSFAIALLSFITVIAGILL